MIKKLIPFLLLTLFASHVYAGVSGDDELLEPDKAFALSTKVIDSNTVEANWNVADGYYLYRDKFKFAVTKGGATIGDISFPKGKIKKDPTFGDTEVYLHKISLKIPLTRSDAGKGSVSIRFDYQGCNEPIGVCYPPIHKEIAFALPAGKSSKPLQSLESLNDVLNDASGPREFLPPEKAFPVSADRKDGNTIGVIFGITEGYYLYRDKIGIHLLDANGGSASGVQLGTFKLPRGKMKKDPTFGDTEVFKHSFKVGVPLEVTNKALTASKLRIDYQGCAEDGVCYPNHQQTYEVKFDNGRLQSMKLIDSGIAPAYAASKDTQVSSQQQEEAGDSQLSQEEKLARLFAGDNLFATLTSLLGFGLLLAFTACMYPMIPILSSIITGQGEKVTPIKGFALSAVYVGGMAVTFGVIGGIIGFFGQQIGVQAYFQNPWIITLFAILFVALALSMFGFYDIQVPASLQGKISQFSSQQKGGTFVGVAIIGVLSALIVGPCGGPVLLGTLAGAASSGSWVLGFLYMFVLAVGMGLPLLLVGAGGGTLLPKAGAWMATVKAVAGVVLLAVAIYFLERVLPAHIFMLMWAALFIISAVYMGALEPVPEGASGWRRLWKGLGLAILVYGIIVMLGGLTGARNFNDPLHGSSLTGRGGDASVAIMESGGKQPAYIKSAAGKPSVIKGGLTFIKIKTWDDFQRELKAANAKGHTVMLDFYADWCTYCKQFDDYVFSDAKVQAAFANTVLLQADVTDLNANDKLLMKNLKVVVPPAMLFFKTDGMESKRERVIGFMKADQFLNRMQRAFAS
jgi:thiol:disulfide interchange protein DsbD